MTPDTLSDAGPTQADSIDAWVLVTNDDGIDSPALPPLLRVLAGLAQVRAVVPAREYSWSAKTLSRFGRLRLTPVSGDHPCELYALDGSPADCANVGIHNLAPTRPQLVVSGVNIGANAGLAYLLSSGTVGAAVESCLSGVPAAAFSAQLRPEDYAHWRAERDPGRLAETWERAAEITGEITGEILAAGLPTGAQLVSVNLPPDADRMTPRVMTGVNDSRYGPFFHRGDDGGFEHRYRGLQRPDAGGQGDLDALDRGQVAITPLCFRLDVEPSVDDRVRFERS